jgi:hypothetical protein
MMTKRVKQSVTTWRERFAFAGWAPMRAAPVLFPAKEDVNDQ